MAKKKIKAIEKNVELEEEKFDEVEWEGEELVAESTTKIQDDKGTGQEIIMRFFDFAANKEVFKQHRPTAQELFDSHKKGIESLLWTDGLLPFIDIEPRLMFSKDKSHYRFGVACIPSLGNTLIDKTKTLSELLR